MRLNNVNLDAMEQFAEQAQADPGLTKRQRRVEGEWCFEEGKAQFRATLAHPQGERVVEADFAPFMGGSGIAPDPIAYCLFGTASCFAGTFVSLAAAQGVRLRRLAIIAENRVDLSAAMGLSHNPIVEQVGLTLQVDSDADDATLDRLEHLARERCPGVYCLVNPIPLTTKVVRGA